MPEKYHISKDGLQTGGPDTVNVGGAETPIHQENGEPATALQEIQLRTDEERAIFPLSDRFIGRRKIDDQRRALPRQSRRRRLRPPEVFAYLTPDHKIGHIGVL